VWRADDGHVNVWENRCLHRGVRLSIGSNDGTELICQYHGWRYANRTAGCTYIPAHPADAPARTICNTTYPVVEQYGLIWSGESPLGALPEISSLTRSFLTLRSIPINASLHRVRDALLDYQLPTPRKSDFLDLNWQIADEFTLIGQPLRVAESSEHNTTSLVLVLQPVDAERTVVRGVQSEVTDAADPIDLLKLHTRQLSTLRKQIEAAPHAQKLPAWTPYIKPVSESLAALPALDTSARKAPLRVSVDRISETAEDIKAFELVSIGNPLPTFQPGAHIDVHLPNGLVRQYSLTNAPGQTDRYIIGVKRDPVSTGGSALLHDQLKAGDVLAISAPRNNFSLRRDAVNTLLVAGGIGITPLLSMARALHHSDLPFELHYFASSEAAFAFREVLKPMQERVVFSAGLSPKDTLIQLRTALAEYHAYQHVYICGPEPMLSAARQTAHELGWPDSAVHFEYFKNSNEIHADSSFTIDLARSGVSLTVPAGKSILETLRENGIDMPSSCEQGACGTCKVSVIEGEPLHQDVYLNPTERQAGTSMMTCVSRAKSDRLILDL